MVHAYILVQQARPAASLVPLLRSVPGILSVEDTSGAYDAIALAVAESTRHLLDDVVATVSRLPGVTRAIAAPLIGSADEALAPVGIQAA